MPDFATVGALRAALKDRPDDQEILCQVVGQDHSAWYMLGTVGEIPGANPPKLAVSLSHPTLRTLPKWPDPDRRVLVSRAALAHLFEHAGGDLPHAPRAYIEDALRETRQGQPTAVCQALALRALLADASNGYSGDRALGYMAVVAIEHALEAPHA
jgi:hypothetical protein